MKKQLFRTSAALTLATAFGLGALAPAAAQASDQAGGPPPATQPDSDPIIREGTADVGTDTADDPAVLPEEGAEPPVDTADDPSPEEIWEQEGEGLSGAGGGSASGPGDD
jgi:hypothetical protein